MVNTVEDWLYYVEKGGFLELRRSSLGGATAERVRIAFRVFVGGRSAVQAVDGAA